MENITLKEFKETLKGTQFEGFNLEDVLNALSIFCDHQAKEYKQKGLMVLSEYSEKKKRSNNI